MANTISTGTDQIQVTINKQEIALKQDQNLSNSIMSKTLAELENLVLLCGYKGKPLFNYYASKCQTKKEMINQIVYQMTIFSSSYRNFIKKNPNKTYDYPENLNYQTVVAIVNNWKNHLKKDKSNLEKYYDSFLKVLEGKKLDQYILEEFNNIDADSTPTTEDDLKRMLNAGAIANSLTNDKNKEIEKNIIEKGGHKVTVVLGGKREDNKFNKQFEKNEETFKKYKKELSNLFYSTIGYLELYYKICLNTDDTLKYVDYIKDELKKDFLKKYEENKEEFINKNLEITEYFDYNFFKGGKVEKVEADLEIWKSKLSKKSSSKIKEVIKEIDNAINVLCKGKLDSIK